MKCILHDGTKLNVSENGQIVENKFNDFFINVASHLLTKSRNQQNIIHNNITTMSITPGLSVLILI